MYGYKRLTHQTDCRQKFEHVIDNVKKKMIMLNKRLEMLLFTSDYEVKEKILNAANVQTTPRDRIGDRCRVCQSRGNSIFLCSEGVKCKSMTS